MKPVRLIYNPEKVDRKTKKILPYLTGEKHIGDIVDIDENLLYWPEGERDQAKRGAILMAMGMKYLESMSPTRYSPPEPTAVPESGERPLRDSFSDL